MSSSDNRSLLREACVAALRGELELDDLHGRWGGFADSASAFERGVFGDLEFGVEHTPGYFFRRGVNLEKWRSDSAYRDIRLDLFLLAPDLAGVPDDALLRCRSVLSQVDGQLDDEALAEAIRRCLDPESE